MNPNESSYVIARERSQAFITEELMDGNFYIRDGFGRMASRWMAEEFKKAAEFVLSFSDEQIAKYNGDVMRKLHDAEVARDLERHRANEARKKVSNKTFVYLMKNRRNGYTKIGVSISPKKREKTFQSEEPEVELIFSAPTVADVEPLLHARYSKQRIRGEWFNLTPQDIAEIPRLIPHLEESL